MQASPHHSDWTLEQRREIFRNPALQTASGVVRLCPKVQNLYSKMATSFNSYPNRPLSSDLFYMTDETYNEERALVSLWQSFQGMHKEVNNLLLEKVGGARFVMDLLPIVTAQEAEQKYNLNMKGDTVRFFTWTFDATAQDPKAKSAPGMITRAKTTSETRTLDYYGSSFVVPMDFATDETQARVFKKYFEQMVANIQETLSYGILNTMRDEALIAQSRRYRDMMPMRERDFVRALLSKNARDFAFNKRGVGWKGIVDDKFTELQEINKEPTRAVLSAGALRHVELINPVSRELSAVGDRTGRGVVVSDKRVEGSYELPGYGIKVHSSKRYRRPDGSRHDPTTGVMCVPQFFTMTPEHRAGTDDYDHYRTRQRSIRIRNGDTGRLEEITLQQAVDASCIFEEDGRLSVLGQKVVKALTKSSGERTRVSAMEMYEAANIVPEVAQILTQMPKSDYDALFTSRRDHMKGRPAKRVKTMHAASAMSGAEMLEALIGGGSTPAAAPAPVVRAAPACDTAGYRGKVVDKVKEVEVTKLQLERCSSQVFQDLGKTLGSPTVKTKIKVRPFAEEAKDALMEFKVPASDLTTPVTGRDVYIATTTTSAEKSHIWEDHARLYFSLPSNYWNWFQLSTVFGEGSSFGPGAAAMDHLADKLNSNNDAKILLQQIHNIISMINSQEVYKSSEDSPYKKLNNWIKNVVSRHILIKDEGFAYKEFKDDINNVTTELNRGRGLTTDIDTASYDTATSEMLGSVDEHEEKLALDEFKHQITKSRVPGMERRTEEVVLERLCDTDFTYGFVRRCLTKNVPVPLSFVLFRPHVTFQTGSAMFLKPSRDTGMTIIKDGKVILNADADHMSLRVDSHISVGTMIRDPRAIAIAENVVSVGYLGGAGTGMYCREHREDVRARKSIESADIFVCAVPYNWRPRNGVYIDMTGCVDDQVKSSYEGECDYDTAKAYADFWQWKHSPTNYLFSLCRSQSHSCWDYTTCVQDTQHVWEAGSSGGWRRIKGLTSVGDDRDAADIYRALSNVGYEYEGRGIEGSVPMHAKAGNKL